MKKKKRAFRADHLFASISCPAHTSSLAWRCAFNKCYFASTFYWLNRGMSATQNTLFCCMTLDATLMAIKLIGQLDRAYIDKAKAASDRMEIENNINNNYRAYCALPSRSRRRMKGRQTSYDRSWRQGNDMAAIDCFRSTIFIALWHDFRFSCASWHRWFESSRLKHLLLRLIAVKG